MFYGKGTATHVERVRSREVGGRWGRYVLIANLTLIVLSVGFSVGYLALNNRTAARGFMVRTVEKRIADLRREADRLDMQVVAMQAMGNIEGQVGELGLVPVEGLDYVSAIPAVVAVR
ncbi:hypothetical protein A2480_00915 [Candidatus Uhrbacteria bacterium RIFOXYC2_FULL_47_19]|uniref:Cell division protein FtsL n=1 Tax=Candidatus Uhrbacteria bacterium RIFOXYC2_FULL_47_19 TaxID=1802424 RepID=A0A1F7WE64_9BACT|nr:MAG: hypothetical protein A2480_00915 [Candidatus Uhrbacteria bacterium RIFOXYC2_FULL_47_19]